MTAEREALRGMLQTLEHVLDSADQASVAAGQVVHAHKTNKQLAPATLTYYENQLAELSKHREHMRGLIAEWWTMFGEAPH